MTEREKMLRGELYDPSDDELVALRTRARKLAYAYNLSQEGDTERRRSLLDALLGSHGDFYYCRE